MDNRNHNFIHTRNLFTRVLSDIFRNIYSKSNEEQNNTSEEDLKNNIILDSGSSIVLFRNPQLLKNVKRSNKVRHLSTNVGYKIDQIKVMVLDYGKVRYEDISIANIFSLTNLVKKFRVTYDSHQYDIFVVYTNPWIIKRSRNKQGIHVFNNTYTTENLNDVTTVEENMMVFTSRRIERAKLSKKSTAM